MCSKIEADLKALLKYFAAAVVFDCAAFEMSESLYDALRGDPAHPDVPIVIITDTPDAAVASLTGRQARRVLLVTKPFRGSDVVRALDQLLDSGPPAESQSGDRG